MIATSEGAAVIDGSRWIQCTKSATLGCNWLVPEAQDKVRRGRCFADSLIRAQPDADDTIAQEKLADTTTGDVLGACGQLGNLSSEYAERALTQIESRC